ncbi:AAA family ATPase [Niallia sp. FSL W8-0177]|uniref:AAA family ATPase n=1 Tax=Niallia sp. FSL W8-0177 TaxID=2954522 RepID=UPI0030F4F5DB
MELIYAWIEKFRNYKEVELNFSEKFKINYDHANKAIKVVPNETYISIYPEYITNINAVVGRNSVGKTNLLDAIGLRTNDRNKNNAEFEIRYKQKKKLGYQIPDDVEAEIKNSIYFFLYYMGKDSNDQDLFCIEGNDIDSFQDIIKSDFDISKDYWRSKYWFAFVCKYVEGRFIYKYDLNSRIGEYRTEIEENETRLYGDSRREMDKLAIISLRENLNEKYYDASSTKPEDDYKISVPRRIGTFQSKFLSKKIEMLFNQLQKPKRLMFKDKVYILKINYDDYFLKNSFDEENKLIMKYSYNDLDGKEQEVCRVLESFVQYFFNSIKNNITSEMIIEIKRQTIEINLKKMSFKGLKNYYYKIIKIIADTYFEEKEHKQYVLNCFMDVVEELSKNKNIKFNENYITLKLTKNAPIEEFLNVINKTVDEKIQSIISDREFSVFSGFFSYVIEDISDGEAAYLGFFASLNEQVSSLTPNKENYIILLDEPEARMHPELTRNFINELVLFLGDLSESKKKFQVVTSTHSPLILSDIPNTNMIYLEKDNDGNCRTIKKGLNTFGANIHILLKDGFFMSSTMGEFATNKIKEVILLINTYSVGDVTQRQRNECLYIINSIGEPLIRNRIMKMFNEKFDLDYTDLYNENLQLRGKLKKYEEPRKINETIEILKRQIESLQVHVSELEGKLSDKD